MRNCPICNVELIPTDYERMRVMHCSTCHGYLVDMQRLESIKRIRETPEVALATKAREYFKGSSSVIIQCPRCHVKMKKQVVKADVELAIDVCKRCRLVWLDGGELELLQLMYQASTKGRDAAEFMNRVAKLDADPERTVRFQENLKKMPKDMPVPDGILARDYMIGGLLGTLIDLGDELYH